MTLQYTTPAPKILPLAYKLFGRDYCFGFNGQEKDNEIKGIGNSLDFGARMYGSREVRWMSLDPLATKYPSLSPYAFVGNSPIMLVDPDGKKLILKGNRADIDRTITLMQSAVGDYFTVKKGRRGQILLIVNPDAIGTPTTKQQTAIDVFTKIANPETKTTRVGVVSNDDGVTTGNFEKEKIDIADMEMFDKMENSTTSPNVFSSAGKLIHEFEEQYQKQVEGKRKFYQAHNPAIDNENEYNGSKRSYADENGNSENVSEIRAGGFSFYTEIVETSDKKKVGVGTESIITNKKGHKGKELKEQIQSIKQIPISEE